MIRRTFLSASVLSRTRLGLSTPARMCRKLDRKLDLIPDLSITSGAG